MSATVRSMTGFARVRRTTPEGELVLSLRAVNHRGLDLQFHLPPELDPYETTMRRRISETVTRGHVDVRVHFLRAGRTAQTALNRSLLETWTAAFRQASRELGIPGEPDLNVALRMPGMLLDGSLEDLPAGFENSVIAVLADALEKLNAERAREGAATVNAVKTHCERILAAVLQMESIRAHIVPALQARILEKMSDLLAGAIPDPARLAQEAAFLADRGDIAEELSRLGMHVARLEEILDAGGEAGKKVEFLAQEMHRETNTVLAKSTGAGEPGRRVTELALAIKSEVEKIREQSLNLE